MTDTEYMPPDITYTWDTDDGEIWLRANGVLVGYVRESYGGGWGYVCDLDEKEDDGFDTVEFAKRRLKQWASMRIEMTLLRFHKMGLL